MKTFRLLLVLISLLLIHCSGQPNSSSDEPTELSTSEKSILKSTSQGASRIDTALGIAKSGRFLVDTPPLIRRLAELLKPCQIRLDRVDENNLSSPANAWEIIEANGNDCPVDIKHRHHFVVTGTPQETHRLHQFQFSFSVKNDYSEFAELNDIVAFSIKGQTNIKELPSTQYEDSEGTLDGIIVSRTYGEISFHKKQREWIDPAHSVFIVDIPINLQFPGRFDVLAKIKGEKINGQNSLIYLLNGSEITATDFDLSLPKFR